MLYLRLSLVLKIWLEQLLVSNLLAIMLPGANLLKLFTVVIYGFS
jgi:hypothetical protein